MARTDNSDIFISYRRLNIDFAQKLEQALRDKDFEIWFDLEDIPPASPSYLDDIYKGVEGADIFIPILSPDYIKSDICLKELRYAAQNHKRIIPIIYQDGFDTSPLPDAAKNPNWIYFCEHLGNSNEFDEAFPTLMEGIQLNRDYTRKHTQYLARAKQWEAEERHDDALLKGDEITKSETWLATETKIDPYPTPLQAQYILTSRQKQDKNIGKRRRDVLGLFLLALVGVVILLNNFIGTIDLAGEDNLKSFIGANLQAGVFYIIDAEALFALNDAIDRDDEADIDSFAPVIENNLLWLEAFYPDINSYMMDIESNGDDRVIILYDPLALPIPNRTEFSSDVVYSFQQDFNLVRWVVGELDIQDSAGNYAGTLVMEYRDPLTEVQSSITSTFGLVLIGVIVLFITYVIVYLWGIMSAWLSKRRNPASKLAAKKSGEDAD